MRGRSLPVVLLASWLVACASEVHPARSVGSPASGFVVAGSVSGGRTGRHATQVAMGPRASDALTVTTGDGRPLRLWRHGASQSPGHREDGVVVYERAFPGADTLVFAQGEGVEELLVARRPGTEASYEVDLPARWRLREQPGHGLVEVLDETGSAQLRVWATQAWDASGAEARLTLSARGRRLRVGVAGEVPWPVVIDPVFVGAGTMLAARTEHTATRLADGTILLVGGVNEGAISAEIHDPRTGRFTATAGPTSALRKRHTATLLADGRVLIAGGVALVGPYFTTLATAEVYDPATGLFSPTPGSMSIARNRQTATRLADGRVLISHGDDDPLLVTAEIFDPTSGVFTPTASPQQRRYHSTATRLTDGRVLIAGGDIVGPGTAEVYDPATGLFLPPTPLGDRREYHTATLLADGRVLLAGGTTSSSPLDTVPTLEVYDPATDAFSLLPSTMIRARNSHTATALPDGRIVFVGGESPSPPLTEVLATAEWFDPVTGQSRAIGPELLAPRSGHTATGLDDGRILLTGGTLDPSQDETEVLTPGDLVATETSPLVVRTDHTASTLPGGRVLLAGGTTGAQPGDVVDPATGVFAPTPGAMQVSRSKHSATELADGTVLLAGGQDDSIGGEFLASAEVYDPSTGLFSPTAGPMASVRSLHTETRLADGHVLITGGYQPTTKGTDEAELYDPATRTFAALTVKMTQPRLDHTATLLSDGRVLLAGGEPIGVIPSDAELYDPLARSFTPTAGKLTRSRIGHTATRLGDGRVLFTGGDGQNTAELYDPATGTFGATPPMNTRRSGHTATLLLDGRVLLAGGDINSDQGTAELYDPGTSTFTALASLLRTNRSLHSASRLPDGRVLLVGGLDSSGPIGTAEIFDPAKGVFTSVHTDRAVDGRAATETAQGALRLTGGVDGAAPLLLTGTGAMTQGTPGPARRHHAATLLHDQSLLLTGGIDADDQPLDTLVRLDASGVAMPAVGRLEQARAWHSATRLPDGRVLVAGGEADGAPIGSFELLDPATGVIGTGTLLQPRTHHAAALLPDGRVLLVGGTNQQGAVGLAEVFDPATRIVSGLGQAPAGGDTSVGFVANVGLIFSGLDGSLRLEPGTNAFIELALEPASRLATLATGHVLACQQSCRFLGAHSSSGGNAGSLRLLPDDHIKAVGTGALALLGTRGGEGWTGWGSVLDADAARPALDTLTRDTWLVGEQGSVGGHGWSATGAPTAPPRFDDDQLLAWRPLDGVGPVHLVDVRAWASDRIDFTLPRTVYHGPGLLYAVVHGVPGEGRLVTLLPALAGQSCGSGPQCASGFCVDGVCCDQGCRDGCLACSAAAKGQGVDGVCGPVTASQPPRFGCDNPARTICGFTGACDGNGACVLPGLDTVCTDLGDRCQGGVCAPPPGLFCNPTTNEALSVGSRQSCNEYRCRDGVCPLRCDSHQDCIDGHRCTSDHRCEPSAPLAAARDPGLLCAASPGRASTSGGWLLAALATALLGRRRRRAALVGASASVALVARAQTRDAATGVDTPLVPTSASVPSPSASAPAASPREQARDLLRRGLALYQAGDLPRAAEYFLRSRRLFPAKGNTLNAANTLRRLGRLDESLELYEEAVASHSAAFDEDDRAAVPATMAELRPRLASLFVSATTSGALVIDGRERGRLPLASPLWLLAGDHTVRVIKDGYRTFEARLRVVAGESARLDARLEPLATAGGLRVEDPTLAEATVVVDGVDVGQTPWEGTLAPGPHVVWSRRGDHGSAPTLAVVLQGQTALLRLKSSQLGDTWHFTSRPSTAELRLDDVPLGRGKWSGPLPAGAHTLSASEEGYFPVSRVLTTTEDDPGGDLALDLPVDLTHPRWPRRPGGTLLAELRLGYALGHGLAGDASRGCASSRCLSRDLLGGPSASLSIAYEFPRRLSIEAHVGGLGLSQSQRRTVARRDPDGSYRLDEQLRLSGTWLGVGAGYRSPLGGRWSLRTRLLAGVLFARSSDTLTGVLSTASGEARVGQDGSGDQVSSTPLWLQSEVGVVAALGDWRLAAAVSAWAVLSSGPSLPGGDLRVSPDCPPDRPTTTPGCARDSSQLAGERAYRAFTLLQPSLSLARAF